MLSLKQIENVCFFTDTTGKKCRYLSLYNNKTSDVYVCLKLSENKKKTIDEQVRSYISYSTSKNQNHPPLGDNCHGYPFSLYVKQGYDIKE